MCADLGGVDVDGLVDDLGVDEPCDDRRGLTADRSRNGRALGHALPCQQERQRRQRRGHQQAHDQEDEVDAHIRLRVAQSQCLQDLG